MNRATTISLVGVIIAAMVWLFGNDIVGRYILEGSSIEDPTEATGNQPPGLLATEDTETTELDADGLQIRKASQNLPEFIFDPNEELVGEKKYMRLASAPDTISYLQKHFWVNVQLENLPSTFSSSDIREFYVTAYDDTNTIVEWMTYESGRDPTKKYFSFKVDIGKDFRKGNYRVFYGFSLKKNKNRYYYQQIPLVVVD